MSYRKQGTNQYQMRRPANRFLSATYLSPGQQANFRKDWDRGLEEAEERIKRIREEGWNVETRRTWIGVPDKLKSDMAREGFDMETVPIANWQGEDIVFVAFRPKTAPVVPPIQSQSAAQPIPLRTDPDPNFTADKAIEAFCTAVGKPSSEVDNDNGFLISPDGSWGFASRTATTPNDGDKKDLIEEGRKLVNEPPRAVFNNCDNVREAFQNAAKAGKDVVDFITPQGQPSTGGISIELIDKVLDSLGGGDIRVVQNTDGPAYFANHQGDMAIVQFANVDPNDPKEQEIVARYGDFPGPFVKP